MSFIAAQQRFSIRVILSLLILSLGCADHASSSSESASIETTGDGKSDSASQTADATLEDLSKLTCSEPPQGWNPNGVHEQGEGQQFEGWYYRVTEPETGESWVVITAFWLNDEGRGRFFIELIQGSTGATYKQVFEEVDIKQYQENPGEFSLLIGDVFFSADYVSGQFIDDQGAEVNLEFNIDACAYWGAPEDDRNRWTMGWATEIIGPPLKWHVHHLKGEAHGAILVSRSGIEEVRAHFSGAPVHQEKNWGSEFPKRWVWMQSNVFEDRPDVAFAAAGGPVFGFDLSPSGYMMGLRWRDQFFTWRTQDGHQFKDVDFHLDRQHGLAVWTLRAESLRYRADLRVTGAISELIPVDVPEHEGLVFGAFEHLSADLSINLYVREGLFGWKKIDQIISSHTAVEAGGELAHQILSELDRE
jgi:hypothetical protein